MKQTKKPTGGGKPAKPVTEFGQVRSGTARYEILKMMSEERDGVIVGDDVAHIALAVGVSNIRVLQHAYCLWRDIGVGYRLNKAGRLTAIYPPNKTFSNAIKDTTNVKGRGHRPYTGPAERDRERVAGDGWSHGSVAS